MSVALLFSPQGSQTVGMGQALASSSPAADEAYREADAALGWSVSGTCWSGPEDRLNDTRQTQPCLVATSIACLRALGEALERAGRPISAHYVAGHSVGEYAALVAAGAVSLADALRLTSRRAALMADAPLEGGMLVVIGLERRAVNAVVTGLGRPDDLVVANDNAPGQVVISGARDALAAAQEALVAAGAKRVLPLKVSGPFHSPLMATAGRELAADLDETEFRDADPPLISNVTAEPVRDAARLRELLARQVCSPVEWVASVRRMASDGVDTFVECGPGSALTGMVRRIVPDARTLNVSDPESLAAAVAALQPAAAVAEASA
jgi:[acyl-carrier-protein] S-malonyltransferase